MMFSNVSLMFRNVVCPVIVYVYVFFGSAILE